MFELVLNRLYTYVNDSTLLAVVRKPGYRPAIAASPNRDLARFRSSTITGAWYWILTPLRRYSWVDPGLRSLPIVNWSCLGFLSEQTFILSVKFDSKLAFEDHVPAIASRVYQRIGILSLVKRIFADTSVLLRCYSAFVLTILEYCSPVWGQLLNVTFRFSSARCIRCPGVVLIRVSCRCVIGGVLLGLVCCTWLIRTLITVCSASFHQLILEFDIFELRWQFIHWSLEY